MTDGRRSAFDKAARRLAPIIGIRAEADLDRLRQHLAEAAIIYEMHQQPEYGPTQAEIRAMYLSARKHLTPLIASLESLPSSGEAWLQEFLLPLNNRNEADRIVATDSFDDSDDIGDPAEAELEFDRGLRWLNSLDGALEALIEKLPKSEVRGRKPRTDLYSLIASAAEIYEWATRQPARSNFSYSADDTAYGGPFFLFCTECVQEIDPSIKLSNNALGDLIRRRLGMRR